MPPRISSLHHQPYSNADMPQTFTRSTAISVAVDPVALITTECIAVTSAMRKHARWAHSSVSAILGGGATTPGRAFASKPSSPRESPAGKKGARGRDMGLAASPADGESGLAIRWGLRGKKGKSMQDNPLMSAFAHLRSDLIGCKGRSVQWPCQTCSTVDHSIHDRCSIVRYPLPASPFPAGHSLVVYLGSYYFSCPRCNHEILCVQPHQRRLSSSVSRDAASLVRHHPLPLRS